MPIAELIVTRTLPYARQHAVACGMADLPMVGIESAGDGKISSPESTYLAPRKMLVGFL